MRLSIDEIKASYTEEDKERSKKDPWAYSVMRPISPYIAYPLIKWGITANQVTLFALVVGLIGCAHLTYGTYLTIIIGAVLVNTHGLADYVDGTIAKATNTITPYGARIDGISYLVMVGLLFICIGIGLHNPIYLVLGFIASYTRIARFAVSYQAQLPHEPSRPNILFRWGMVVITARDPLLLVCALTNALGFFLVLYAVANTCELGVILIRLFKK